MPFLLPILRLTRLESALLASLAIFVPLFARTADFSFSLRLAIPLLFICVCTFTANDLDDFDADKINHPDRPLPNGDFSPMFAVILYFIFLGLALFSIAFYVRTGVDFLYYAVLSMSIRYDYVVEHFPGFKSSYVALMSSIPVVIVVAAVPNEPSFYVAGASAFLLTLGREICMDIKDRPGDRVSFMHDFDAGPLATFALLLQLVGQAILIAVIDERADIAALAGMTLFLGFAAISWFKFERLRLSLILMKLQFFAGLYLLT